MRHVKKLAVCAILFFIVNAFLVFRSFSTTYYGHATTPYDQSSELSRRLGASHTVRDRIINSLKAHRGIEPGDPDFQRLFLARLSDMQKTSEAASNRRITLRKLQEQKNTWIRPNKEWQTQLIEAREQQNMNISKSSVSPLSICGRGTGVGTSSDLALPRHNQDNTNTCPGANSNKLLLIKGNLSYGRTGNNLVELLHALQYSRDFDVTLGIMDNSWAQNVLLDMFLAIKDINTWKPEFEEALCVKVFYQDSSLDDWSLVEWDDLFELGIGRGALGMNVDYLTSKKMFVYASQAPLHEYVADQSKFLQNWFRNYNTGEGATIRGNPVRDVCSGIQTLFGDQTGVLYSVIHQRSLEGRPGLELMKRLAKASGCDPVAALHMGPDYVKSILKPLGMLKYPIVLITDGQDFSVVRHLMNDPEISPNLRLVPEEATWVGGDITLAVMSDVFIGNPASTFSGFIAKSRLALGKGHSYLFRAKNEKGEWHTTCGDTCIFDKKTMGSMS